MKRHEQQDLLGPFSIGGLPGSVPPAEDIVRKEAKHPHGDVSGDAPLFQQHGSSVSWAHSRVKGK